MDISIYIYIWVHKYIYMDACAHTYIYIYRERERDILMVQANPTHGVCVEGRSQSPTRCLGPRQDNRKLNIAGMARAANEEDGEHEARGGTCNGLPCYQPHHESTATTARGHQLATQQPPPANRRATKPNQPTTNEGSARTATTHSQCERITKRDGA